MTTEDGEEIDTERLNRLSGRIVDACIEVHRLLGPGLLESAYEECLVRELALRGIKRVVLNLPSPSAVSAVSAVNPLDRSDE